MFLNNLDLIALLNLKIKKLLLIVVSISLVGCAISPSVNYQYNPRTDGEVYGNWVFLENENPFDGKYYQSVSYGVLGGKLKLVTFPGSGSYIRLENGDSYICGGVYNNIQVTFLFEDFTGNERMEARARLSDDKKSAIWSDEPFKSKLIKALNRYDNVAIRTEDECGSVRDLIFQIKDETHLKVSDV